MNENLAVFSKDVLKMLMMTIVTDKETTIKSKKILSKINDGGVNHCLFCKKENLQQSRKFAAISNSSAISGAMGNSGISVLLLVYRTLYMKYVHTLANTWELLLITESYKFVLVS